MCLKSEAAEYFLRAVAMCFCLFHVSLSVMSVRASFLFRPSTASIHTHTVSRMHARARAHTHTHICAQTHTHTHAHTRIHLSLIHI